MSIRVCVKALIIREGKILLSCGDWFDFIGYYHLPGGGQEQYESVEEALRREVLEETGYAARSMRFCGIKEEIFTKKSVRAQYPDHSHRINLIYLTEIDTSAAKQAPSHIDMGSDEARWYPLEELPRMKEKLLPEGLYEALPDILSGKVTELPITYYEQEAPDPPLE